MMELFHCANSLGSLQHDGLVTAMFYLGKSILYGPWGAFGAGLRGSCDHSPTGYPAPAPAKPRPFLQPPAPVKLPDGRGVFAGFSYFY